MVKRTAPTLLALTGLVLLLVGPSQAAPGDLDPGFGKGGKVTTEGGAAFGVALQPDGKIVAAGPRETDRDVLVFSVARYRRNGTLDPSFSSDGRQTTSIGETSPAQDVAVDADGRILVVGATTASPSSPSRFALVRYLPDGSLDPAFGADGVVVTGFEPQSAEAFAISVQPDGKIVVAGSVRAPRSADYAFALARYQADGSLDTSFGTQGRVITSFGIDSSIAKAVGQGPNGTIVLAGYRLRFTENEALEGLGFALARYTSEGELDDTFGLDGKVTTTFGGGGAASSLAIQADGQVVAAGTTSLEAGSNRNFALARYDVDGALDPDFGVGGIVTTDFDSGDDVASGVVMTPDGKIVAAGTAQKDHPTFALARYLPDGNLDPTFGKGGRVRTVFGDEGIDQALSIAAQPDGKIVAAGISVDENAARFALARYLDRQPLCIVPGVRRRPLAKARRAIRRAHCSVGRIRHKVSSKVRKGRVIAQHPRRGAHRVAGAKVKLVVSKGKRQRR